MPFKKQSHLESVLAEAAVRYVVLALVPPTIGRKSISTPSPRPPEGLWTLVRLHRNMERLPMHLHFRVLGTPNPKNKKLYLPKSLAHFKADPKRVPKLVL